MISIYLSGTNIQIPLGYGIEVLRNLAGRASALHLKRRSHSHQTTTAFSARSCESPVLYDASNSLQRTPSTTEGPDLSVSEAGQRANPGPKGVIQIGTSRKLCVALQRSRRRTAHL